MIQNRCQKCLASGWNSAFIEVSQLTTLLQGTNMTNTTMTMTINIERTARTLELPSGAIEVIELGVQLPLPASLPI